MGTDILYNVLARTQLHYAMDWAKKISSSEKHGSKPAVLFKLVLAQQNHLDLRGKAPPSQLKTTSLVLNISEKAQ